MNKQIILLTFLLLHETHEGGGISNVIGIIIKFFRGTKSNDTLHLDIIRFTITQQSLK